MGRWQARLLKGARKGALSANGLPGAICCTGQSPQGPSEVGATLLVPVLQMKKLSHRGGKVAGVGH